MLRKLCSAHAFMWGDECGDSAPIAALSAPIAVSRLQHEPVRPLLRHRGNLREPRSAHFPQGRTKVVLVLGGGLPDAEIDSSGGDEVFPFESIGPASKNQVLNLRSATHGNIVTRQPMTSPGEVVLVLRYSRASLHDTVFYAGDTSRGAGKEMAYIDCYSITNTAGYGLPWIEARAVLRGCRRPRMRRGSRGRKHGVGLLEIML